MCAHQLVLRGIRLRTFARAVMKDDANADRDDDDDNRSDLMLCACRFPLLHHCACAQQIRGTCAQR